ncbi:MAG: hypothetical protein JRD69_10330 [Deltaproteobacteria bacterium]|nr:hypothetical protein [Deltaproteobacteria bacterium]
MSEKLKCPLVFGQSNNNDPTQYDCIEKDCKFWSMIGGVAWDCTILAFLNCSIVKNWDKVLIDTLPQDFDPEDSD